MTNLGLEYLKNISTTLPKAPGVYRMINEAKEVLYVGKAKNLIKRVKAYTKPEKLPIRLQKMVFQTRVLEFTVTTSEAEALLLEAKLIKNLQPRYNILLRDDKSFPYIWLRLDHDYPQFIKFRGTKKNNGKYFGPFASASDVNNTISMLQKLFLLRSCTDNYFATRKRPCLQYEIKRCSAPCVNKVSQEDYAASVKQAELFLCGESKVIHNEMVQNMENASNNLDYERAAFYRDRIKMLVSIQKKNYFSDINIKDADILALHRTPSDACIQLFVYRGGQSFGTKSFFPLISADASNEEIMSAFIGQLYQNTPPPGEIIVNVGLPDQLVLATALKQLYGYRIKFIHPKNGNKKQLINIATRNAKEQLEQRLAFNNKQAHLLAEVAKLFNINTQVKRIEVYDNSHISGTHAIGAMIVATEGGFLKSAYRKFTIKTLHSIGDDYQMLREVLTRRLKRLTIESEWPDLLLIDGGVGHLTVVKEVVKKYGLNLNYVCMSKGKERNAGREVFHLVDKSFTLEKDLEVMKYLQRLRDEAHRFAITSHRAKRTKAIRTSVLDNIKDIGPKRKKLLLAHFGSIDLIKEATIEELAKLDGININVAKKIFEYFQDN